MAISPNDFEAKHFPGLAALAELEIDEAMLIENKLNPAKFTEHVEVFLSGRQLPEVVCGSLTKSYLAAGWGWIDFYVDNDGTSVYLRRCPEIGG